jgi:phosphohistidine phosphatase SixA
MSQGKSVVYLVRHGEYAKVYTEEGCVVEGITVAGRQRISVTASQIEDNLVRRGLAPQDDKSVVIYHSPAVRARMSAKVIAKRFGRFAVLEERVELDEREEGGVQAVVGGTKGARIIVGHGPEISDYFKNIGIDEYLENGEWRAIEK